MRTYEDTFERVMIKKANAEKAIKARNKKIIFTATSFSCLCICIMASLAINKSFITADGNKPVESGVSQKISKEEFTVSSSVADVPEPDVVVTDVNGNPVISEDEKAEYERFRLVRVHFALSGIPKDDADKIDIDKSYITAFYEDSNGNEFFTIHLESETFYYEVEIDTIVKNIYGIKKIYK